MIKLYLANEMVFMSIHFKIDHSLESQERFTNIHVIQFSLFWVSKC